MALKERTRTAADELDAILIEQRPRVGAGRFRTMQQLCEETGWSVHKMRKALLAMKAAGRLERGPAVVESLTGIARTFTGFDFKPAKK